MPSRAAPEDVPTPNRLRELWASDRTAVNAWLTLEGSASAEVVAAAEFDAVTLDLQHGAAGAVEAGDVFAAIERAGPVPLARVAWNEPGGLMRMLDVGARGIVCPMIGSAEEAEAFVRWCRYPPRGVRSYGPVRGAFGPGHEQVEGAERIVLLAMIETAEGLGNVDDIAATPGLDGLHVGPADLSLALGLSTFADLSDPELLEALDAVVAAARRHGIVAGVHAPSAERSVQMAGRGFRFVTPAVDADLLGAGASEALARTRAGLGRDRGLS